MEEALHIENDYVIPGHELTFTASRSSGPGGQHVNKTNTRITLHWCIETTTAFHETALCLLKRRLKNRITNEGEIQISVEDERSQRRNREIARERLRDLLRTALKTQKKRIPVKVPAKAKKIRLKKKTQRSKVKRQRRPPGMDD